MIPEHIERERPVTWETVLYCLHNAGIRALTAQEVQKLLVPGMPRSSGARTRLCELHEAGLVYIADPNARMAAYRLSLPAVRLMRMPADEREAVFKSLRRKRRELEAERGREFFERKRQWRNIMREASTRELQQAVGVLR